MNISNKGKILIGIAISLVVSHFLAYPVGQWFHNQYGVGGGWIGQVGPSPGYLDGLFFSYIFVSALLFSVVNNKLKSGFYASSPIVIFDLLLGAFNPQLWMDLILLALGLGLAWLILFLKRKQAG